MAAAVYTTDLLTFNDATTNTGWGEFTGMTLGAGPDIDTDLAIHGTICITQDRAKVGLNSQGYAGTAVTLAVGEGFFIWTKFFAPNSLDSLALGGQRAVLGTDLANWYAYYMDGDDTYDYGGWKNYVIDPTVTPDATNGTVTTYGAAGNGWLLTAAPQKGNPFNTDIIRYGRGESIFTDGDLANGYATFLGYSIINDNPTTGRFGLIQRQGTGYLFKGLMTLGTVALSVDMRVSNTSLTIDNTTKVLAGFNRIEVNNALSNIEWSAVQIESLSLVSKGQFEAIDNALIAFTSCTFTALDTFIFQSNSTILTTTFRSCGLVTQGGATFTNCTFDTPSGIAGLLIDSLSLVTGNTFNSGGTGYAGDLGSIVATSAVIWDNLESGYIIGTTSVLGSDVSLTPTGNETLLVNVAAGQTYTINVASGASTPSVANTGTGVVNVIAGLVNLTINTQDGNEVRVRQGSFTIQHNQSVAGGSETYSYTFIAGTIVTVSVGASGFERQTLKYELPSSDSSLLMTLDPSSSYI